MAARLAAVLPRFVVLTLVFLLATATLTFAAQRTIVARPAAKAPVVPAPEPLVVPDVRGQAYVFAKGMLEDDGFAWRVEGVVQGYAANPVAAQAPAPGARVVDTGAPTIVLRLSRNAGYAQQGTPENASPFIGTPIRVVVRPRRNVPNSPVPAMKPVPAKKPAPAKKPPAAAKPKPANRPARPPAFAVPGAPAEPSDEISLPARARRLQAWISAHRRPTDANVRVYLYQHAWIVAGAKFGWWRGEQALRLLVGVDRHAQRIWGIGAKNELLASRALRLVAERSK